MMRNRKTDKAEPKEMTASRVREMRRWGLSFAAIDRAFGLPDRHGGSWKIINELGKQGTSRKKTGH